MSRTGVEPALLDHFKPLKSVACDGGNVGSGLPQRMTALASAPPAMRVSQRSVNGDALIVGHAIEVFAIRREFWRDHNLGVRSARENDVAGME